MGILERFEKKDLAFTEYYERLSDAARGDLLVMGGSCQRTWQHAVPKSADPRGPRISAQLRPRGVR